MSDRFSRSDMPANPSEPSSRPRRADGAVKLRRFAGHQRHASRYDAPIRVAHLTDLHFGRVTPLSVQRAAIAHANASQPDLVVLTGDFVCHSQDYFDALEQELSQLDAPAYAVLGNHDHWCGADDVAAALRRAGVEVLRNDWTDVRLSGGRSLQLIGLDDAYTGHADRDRATKGIDPGMPALALSHIAEEAEGLWDRQVELVLSGHTHGGQIHFENMKRMTFAALAGHRYVHGLYGSRQAEGALYVSAGIGTSVMPFRIGERGKREVAVFDLGLEPGAVDEPLREEAPLGPIRELSDATLAARRAAAEKKAAKRRRKAQAKTT